MKFLREKPVILAILDGWGIRKDSIGNAVVLANTPNMDHLTSNYPNAELITHGESVGLPPSQVGNSEVGHMNLGAGRKMLMDLPKIDRAIAKGFFKKDANFDFLSETVKQAKGDIHLVGLCSNGGVHCHQNHIFAAIKALRDNGLRVFLHMIVDGRDTPPKSALESLRELRKISEGLDFMATISGRFYAMDRDQRWERTELFFNSLVSGQGQVFNSPQDFIKEQYQLGITDEFIKPAVSRSYKGVQIGKDGIIFMNFRADRIRQIAFSLCDPDFKDFPSVKKPIFSIGASLVNYSDNLAERLLTFFPKEQTKNTVGDVISAKGKKQLRIAETEKYAHVTYFFNCGDETPLEGEDRILVKSPRVVTYDLKPQMSIKGVTAELLKAIDREKYEFIVVNFANPDMVGHTGKIEAAIKACEAVDQAVGKLLEVTKRKNAITLLVADHGNCEEMIDFGKGQPHTSHTLNPVPVILVGEKDVGGIRNGTLADIGPTLLDLMGLSQPVEMTGSTLLKKR